jgi:hypothetical protein
MSGTGSIRWPGSTPGNVALKHRRDDLPRDELGQGNAQADACPGTKGQVGPTIDPRVALHPNALVGRPLGLPTHPGDDAAPTC